MMYGFPEYVDKKIVDIYKNNVNQFLLDLYSQFKSRKIVIWGTGLYGRAVASLLIDNSFNVVGFCDSFFDESENKSIVLNGKQIQVHGFRFYFELFQDAVYFISTDYYQDIIELIKKENISIEYFHDINTQYIEKQLVYFGDYPKFDQLVGVTYNWFLLYRDFVNKGSFQSDYHSLVKLFSNDEMSIEIINKRLMTLLTGDLNYNNSIPLTLPQYFSKNYYESSNLNQGAYIDVGAFNGDTIFDYIKYFGQQNRKILAFEPDENNFKQLSEVVKSSNLKNIELFKAAVGACSGKISFSQNGNMGSHIVDKDNSSDLVDGVNKGLFRIILSPDAGSREVYKNIKGKDYFETTWFNIKKYVEQTRGNVEVKFILEKGNIDDVDNMINMCLKTGVNKVHLSMDVNISETEFYKYESSFSHFVNRCKNEGINLLSIFTFVPEQIKNKVSNLSTE